jgi:Rha family phage regulatory protein
MSLKQLVTLHDNQVQTSSLKVADIFGKEHKNILQSIRELKCSEEFRRLNFQPSSYINEQGKEQPMFEMTKDGFTFLAMGFTGAKADEFKEAYINAFNDMQQLLLKPIYHCIGVQNVKPLTINQTKIIHRLIDEIKTEQDIQARCYKNALLQSYCEQHAVDINAPCELPAILTDKEQIESVAQFWQAIRPIRKHIDHSPRYGEFAISFNHLYQIAKNYDVKLPPREQVEPLLEVSQVHPLLNIRPIWSSLWKKPVKCWIFKDKK